jgi:hypothetical protein
MVHIEKPAMVMIDMDITDYVPEEARTSIVICKLIHYICPKCGFTVSQSLTSKELDAYLKVKEQVKK